MSYIYIQNAQSGAYLRDAARRLQMELLPRDRCVAAHRFIYMNMYNARRVSRNIFKHTAKERNQCAVLRKYIIYMPPSQLD